MRDERPDPPDEPDPDERDPDERDDHPDNDDSAPTRGGSNVPNAGRDPDEGRTE
jgi:hypothetical protein